MRSGRASRRTALSEAQAAVLLRYARRGQIAAVSVGVGSNGYPPGDDAWVMLTDSRSFWLTRDGKEKS